MKLRYHIASAVTAIAGIAYIILATAGVVPDSNLTSLLFVVLAIYFHLAGRAINYNGNARLVKLCLHGDVRYAIIYLYWGIIS